MSGRSWFASAAAGVALAGGLCVALSLQAAEKKSSRASGRQGNGIVGIVTAKTDKDITIKAEGENEAKRYRLAPEGGEPRADLQAALKKVFVPNLVMIESQGQEQPVVTNIRVILPKTRQGVAAGTVVARGSPPKEAWLDVRPSDHGYTQRLWPRFVGGPDGFDKEMVRTFGELNVGDKIKVAWFYDERLRAVKIQVISRAKQADPAGKNGKTASESSSPSDSDR